jgi:hypothetical protein
MVALAGEVGVVVVVVVFAVTGEEGTEARDPVGGEVIEEIELVVENFALAVEGDTAVN